jgi:Cu/Ag efflux pump CusA
VLSVTLTPALAALLIRGRIRGEHENPINRWLVSRYAPIVRFVVRRRGRVVAVALLLLASTVPAFLSLGSEFMPPLNEGTLLYMPTAPPGIAVGEASALGARGHPRVRKGRARRNAHRSGAALDGRDDRAAGAARKLASRAHLGASRSGTG